MITSLIFNRMTLNSVVTGSNPTDGSLQESLVVYLAVTMAVGQGLNPTFIQLQYI